MNPTKIGAWSILIGAGVSLLAVMIGDSCVSYWRAWVQAIGLIIFLAAMVGIVLAISWAFGVVTT